MGWDWVPFQPNESLECAFSSLIVSQIFFLLFMGWSWVAAGCGSGSPTAPWSWAGPRWTRWWTRRSSQGWSPGWGRAGSWRGRRRGIGVELTLSRDIKTLVTMTIIFTKVIKNFNTPPTSQFYSPEVSEWNDAARLCILRLWVSFEFIRASRVTLFFASLTKILFLLLIGQDTL